jgi:hypothetical protein
VGLEGHGARDASRHISPSPAPIPLRFLHDLTILVHKVVTRFQRLDLSIDPPTDTDLLEGHFYWGSSNGPAVAAR